MDRPIRKKAWFRAFRAGKLCIILPYCYKDKNIDHLGKFSSINYSMYCRDDSAYIMWPPIFSKKLASCAP